MAHPLSAGSLQCDTRSTPVRQLRPLELTRFTEHILDSLGMLGDYGQQYSRRCVRSGPPLLPIAECGGRKPELCSELSLTQSHLTAHLAHVDLRNRHHGDADPPALPARPDYRFFQSLNNSRGTTQ